MMDVNYLGVKHVSTSTVAFTVQERSRKGRLRSVNPVGCCISCSGIVERDGTSGCTFRSHFTLCMEEEIGLS